jgi:hypothetical protein
VRKAKETPVEQVKEAAEPFEAKPVREKAPAKPAREKPAPKVETAKAEKPAAETTGDDGWNGPMPGFLSVGFDT